MNVDILIFAIIALVIAYRLYNTLGAVDDDSALVKKAEASSNVVNLKKDQYEVEEEGVVIDEEEQRIVDNLDEEMQEAVKQIKEIDNNFTLKQFLQGVEKAFEIIIVAFVKGDKKTLNSLVNEEMSKKFISEFDNLKKLNRKISIDIVAMIRNVVDNIEINKNIVHISVKLTSEQITVVTDKNGKIVSGNKDQVEEIDDVWTFERDLNAKNNIWRLSYTEN